jgi:hypothetical protein
VRQELGSKPIVVGFARCEREPHWQAIGIDHSMNLTEL